MTEDGLDSLHLLKTTLHFWWLILAGILLGSGIGWLVSHYKQPVYEAKSIITVSIDYVHTGKMTDIEEDHALGVVGALIQSDEVYDKVIASASAQGIIISSDQMRGAFFSERQFYDWVLRVRYPDVKTASILSSLWADAAYEVLNTALVHATNAKIMQKSMDALENCLEAVSAQPAAPTCNLDNFASLQDSIEYVSQQTLIELQASGGVMAGSVITLNQRGVASSRPALYYQGSLVLAGGGIGLLIVLVILMIGLPDRILHR